MLGVGHFAEAILPERAADDTDIIQLGHQVLADLAVQNGVGMLIACKQEGQVQNQIVGHKVAQRPSGGHGNIQGAHLQVLNIGPLIAQLRGVENINLHSAVGLFIDQLGKLFKTQLIGMRNRAGVGGAEDDGISAGGVRSGGVAGFAARGLAVSAAGGQREGHCQGKEPCCKLFRFHLSFSPYIDINVFLKIAKGYLETISKAAAVQRQKARTRFLNSFLFQNLGMALRGQENSRDMAG